jgi:Carboxypeptidase regulatory-like domain/TonB-dependent Receptor Plug Domain
MSRCLHVILSVALAAALAAAQNVSSSVNGTLVDPTGAVIEGATCVLTRQGTGAVLTAISGSEGLFTFPNVAAGSYALSIQHPGFKAFEVKEIAVSSSEIRSLGRLTLQIGEVRESVSVTAETTPLQLSSAERSGVVTGSQINDLALKGRDFFALLQTIPGVVDTAQETREVTSNQPQRGIYINGTRENQKNVSVDGVTAMDTHSNGSTTFQPNMDSIAEVRILTSNYQAEYGRNGGGAITAITKSGTNAFHGSAYEFYRHESLNATNFFFNRSGTPKQPYRYRITGYSIGGPVYFPGKFNPNKEKLFFFWSQEYTGVKTDYGAVFANMPTEAERNGDFSRSFDVNNQLIRITDPQTGQPFPNNQIPRNRIHSLGQSMLNFFPLPNYVDPDPRNQYRWNHRDVYSGATPRRNDILRLDWIASPSLRLYYRWGQDIDDTFIPWGARIGDTNFLVSPVFVDRTGKGHLVSATKIFSPTLVNEASFGFSNVVRDYDFADPDLLLRSHMGNPAQWFDDGNPESNYIPTLRFGGQPANAAAPNFNDYLPNSYRNPVYAVTDNLSKVWGQHSFKTGIYFERSRSILPGRGSYRGNFDFSRDTNNPFDSGHSYSNVLLGNFVSYTEHEQRFVTRQQFVQVEWYVQDNWKVSRRLTLDMGLRFSRMPPMRELDHQAAAFDPLLYDPSKVPVIYVPARDAAGRRVAQDPRSGAFAPAPLIGQYVPGTGDPANGMAVGGVSGYPAGLYERPWVNLAPRFGFAYDLFGDGKTALRGGWGWFYDTGQNNPFAAAVGNAPVYDQPTLYYGNLDTYASSGGALGPQNLTTLYGRHQTPNTMNFSVGLQRQIGGMAVDASYVGSLSRHLYVRRSINPIPLYARFDPNNFDPTQPNRPLPDNFLRPYVGHGDVTAYEHIATTNYHSLQLGVNRHWSRGLQYGVSYTLARTLGLANNDTVIISPYFAPRNWNYGPLEFDRPHVLVFHYIYELPKVGTMMGPKVARWVFDNWQISGITSLISGTPFTPTFTTVDGQDITGSSEGARITVAGDPHLPESERDFFRNFRTEAFQRTPRGEFGNAGVGILRGPGTNNWDITLNKRFPLFGEGRYIQFRTELFNAWNHTQFSGLFTAARFDADGRQVDSNFGAFRTARPARIIQLSAKIVF